MVKRVPASVARELARLFQRNGYVRRVNPDRRATEGQYYKKGDEMRFTAGSLAELTTIQSLLDAAGFLPGRPYAQGNTWKLPVYGRHAVARLVDIVGERAKP
jgi:hypothetical protein